MPRQRHRICSALRSLLIPIVLLLCPNPNVHATDWKGRIVEEDGIPHVYNPSEPMAADQVIIPSQLFRIRGEGEEWLLGAVSRVLCDERGHTYLLDAQIKCVWVFDQEGRFLRALGREGEAPGEWIRAFDMMLFSDERLAVLQMMPSRVVMLTRTGEPLDDHPLPDPSDGGVRMLLNAACEASNLVLELNTPSFDGSSQIDHARVVGVSSGGEERCLYGEATTTTGTETIVIGADRNGIPDAWKLGSDGILYAAPLHREYRIETFDRMAQPLRVITRAYQSLPLADEDLEALRSNYSYSGMPEPRVEVAENACNRDVQAFLVRPNGEIWVQSSRAVRRHGKGSLAEHDVFDTEGRYLCRVAVQLDYELGRDFPVIVGDRLYVIQNAKGMWASMLGGMDSKSLAEEEPDSVEDIEFEIVCYHLPFVSPPASP